MSIDARVRRTQARALLDAVDRAHCGDVPPALLERARRSPVGRRHLARAALKAAPEVFAPEQQRWHSWQVDEPWLQWSQARLQMFALELGAIALGPALRMLVERSAVLRAREALGIEVWRSALAVNPWPMASPEGIRHMGEAVLQRCGRNAQRLHDEVYRRGQIEFIAHAERQHELLAARLRLAYAQPPAAPCKAEGWLPASAVPALLAEQQSLDAPAESIEVPVVTEGTPL